MNSVSTPAEPVVHLRHLQLVVEVADRAQALDDHRMPWLRQKSTSRPSNASTLTLGSSAVTSLEQLDALLDGEQAGLGRLTSTATTTSSYSGRPLDDVEVTVGHRVERAGAHARASRSATVPKRAFAVTARRSATSPAGQLRRSRPVARSTTTTRLGRQPAVGERAASQHVVDRARRTADRANTMSKVVGRRRDHGRSGTVDRLGAYATLRAARPCRRWRAVIRRRARSRSTSTTGAAPRLARLETDRAGAGVEVEDARARPASVGIEPRAENSASRTRSDVGRVPATLRHRQPAAAGDARDDARHVPVRPSRGSRRGRCRAARAPRRRARRGRDSVGSASTSSGRLAAGSHDDVLVLQHRSSRRLERRPDCAAPSTSPSRRCSRSSRASSKPSRVAATAVQPLPCRRAGAALGDEQAQTGVRATADAAAQLVQLRDAEPVGVEHDHHGGVRYVDTDLDHRRGDEHVDVAARRTAHHVVLRVGRQPPVQHARAAGRQWSARRASAQTSTDGGGGPRVALFGPSSVGSADLFGRRQPMRAHTT